MCTPYPLNIYYITRSCVCQVILEKFFKKIIKKLLTIGQKNDIIYISKEKNSQIKKNWLKCKKQLTSASKYDIIYISKIRNATNLQNRVDFSLHMRHNGISKPKSSKVTAQYINIRLAIGFGKFGQSLNIKYKGKGAQKGVG